MLRNIMLRARPIVAVLVVVAAAALTLPASAGSVVHTYTVGRGTTLKTIRMPKYPDEVRVAVLRPGRAVPDIQPADGAYPMWSLTSTMSASAGAILGVNGDFGTAKGQPKHTLMIDGELWTTGQSGGNAVAWSANGKRAYIGHPALKILGSDSRTGANFFVPEWNVGTPPAGGIGAYTARGGSVTRPPGATSPTATDPAWCAARLEPSAAVRWNGASQTSLIRLYTVTVQQEPCPKTPLPVGTTPGAMVLAERFKSGVPNKVKELDVGDTVKIKMTFQGWPGVTDVMGGQQMLVEKGTNVAPAYKAGADHVLDFNPRTAVGLTKGCSDADNTTTCRLIMITVDGRQTSTNWSKGVRLPFLGKLQLKENAWMALNLDGGGSTTMWLRHKDTYCQSMPSIGGCLINRPFGSSQQERSTRTAIVILPSADAGTPTALR
jgi:hypothetical protein